MAEKFVVGELDEPYSDYGTGEEEGGEESEWEMA
jgi:hypothetical protein